MLRFVLPFLLLLPVAGRAQDTPDTLNTEALDAWEAAYTHYLDSLDGSLTFLTDTTVTLGADLATLRIPEGYAYLGPDDAQTVLVDMWGNMPDPEETSLGMLFPVKYGPSARQGYGIHIDYTADGYIDDSDAADMDYDDLLEELQEGTEAGNAYREEEGYQPMHLLGWATPPHYDAVNQRLHWAKELEFEGSDVSTLNYNVLFLGRRGYVTYNAIGTMENLPEVNDDLDDFLGSLAYNAGNRYADFDPDIDEVAGYGIAALMGAKVLAKTGLLAGIGVFLLKAWKLVMVAVVAAGAGLKRLLGK